MSYNDNIAIELIKVLDAHRITIEEAVDIVKEYKEKVEKVKKRKIQYYEDTSRGVWCYLIRGEKNPCGCGSNCYHYEYDKEKNQIYGVCNACNTDIYELKEEYTQDALAKGVWV